MRPRGQPFRELATALVEQGVIGSGSAEVEAETRAFLEATLRRGPLGLVEALREGRLPADESVLLVVNQFEEIFRFHRHGGRDEADAFVALLLESAAQGAVPPESRLPVYVVLTMRSDFLGDCASSPASPRRSTPASSSPPASPGSSGSRRSRRRPKSSVGGWRKSWPRGCSTTWGPTPTSCR